MWYFCGRKKNEVKITGAGEKPANLMSCDIFLLDQEEGKKLIRMLQVRNKAPEY